MSLPERLSATPAGVRLGPLDTIADGGARNFVIEIGGRHFHGFVVRRGAQVFGYVDRCPHMGVPLARELDAYMSPVSDHILCSWHGALFRIEDGRCVGGPCTGKHLAPWPIKVISGSVETA